MKDRKPLLIDEVLALEHKRSSMGDPILGDGAKGIPYIGRDWQNIHAAMLKARRFVLDNNAAQKFGQVMREIPDVIAAQQEFARPPYDTMWVEFDAQTVYKEASGLVPDDKSDVLLGYLFYEGRVYSFFYGKTKDNRPASASAGLIVYDLHRPWKVEEQMKFANESSTSRLGLVSWVWGSPLRHWLAGKVEFGPDDEPALATAKSLRNLHTARWVNEKWVVEHLNERNRAGILDSCAGDLRNIITLLLLMNQPSIVSYSKEIGAIKGFSRGKLRKYLSHNIVSISVDPQPIMRRMSAGHGSPHRRHEVRGHYCHDEKTRQARRLGCEHKWEQTDPNHWQCSVCHGSRWWRKHHERGDASIGFATKQYAITE
jgi:hypothetical protein